MEIYEIINKYATGEVSLEETNATLKEHGAIFHLEPNKNEIAKGEEERFGMLDTGTGTLDKVEIRNGELVNMDCGEMYAECIFNGKTYRVHGNKLGEEI